MMRFENHQRLSLIEVWNEDKLVLERSEGISYGLFLRHKVTDILVIFYCIVSDKTFSDGLLKFFGGQFGEEILATKLFQIVGRPWILSGSRNHKTSESIVVFDFVESYNGDYVATILCTVKQKELIEHRKTLQTKHVL